MPNMLWALEYFFSAVILVITVLGGKEEVHCAYDGQTFPISSQRPGDLFNISRGRERVVTEGGDRDKEACTCTTGGLKNARALMRFNLTQSYS
jgi:hypothetical protein